jgi:hypothetical protein
MQHNINSIYHHYLVDVGENVPKEEDSFLKVEDDKIRADCNFRKVCD